MLGDRIDRLSVGQVNEILVCEYVTEYNVAPPGVRKLNKQAVDFGYVVTVKLNSGVQIQSH